MAWKTALKKILLIDENSESTVKAAISMRWSLLLNCLPDDTEGQDKVIQKRTHVHTKVWAFMCLDPPPLEDALIHV